MRFPIKSVSILRHELWILLVMLMFACGVESDLLIEDLEQEVSPIESTHHELTPMWGTKPNLQKYRGKAGSQTHRGPVALNTTTREADQEGNDWVRETGFRSNDESNPNNETDFVRETGFLPTPRLTLVSVEDGVAHLSWTEVPTVAYYLLNGRIVEPETGTLEQHGTSYILRGTEMSLALEGEIWEFRVTAVGNDKWRRSKASNRVQADPNAE